MSSITPIAPNNIQTCPHGLSPGACPVCSGMGGSVSSTKKADPAPKNEMSYAECYAIWMRMKAADARKEQALIDAKNRAEFLQNTKQFFQNTYNLLSNVLNKIENILPSPLNTVFSLAVNNILKPLVNLIKNIPEFISDINKFVNNIQKEIQRIVYIASEKLSSLFGEIKNFINKKISNSFKKFTKKVYKILNLFGLKDEDDFEEDEKANAEIKAFKTKDVVSIKEFLISLSRMEKRKDHDTKYNNITNEQ